MFLSNPALFSRCRLLEHQIIVISPKFRLCITPVCRFIQKIFGSKSWFSPDILPSVRLPGTGANRLPGPFYGRGPAGVPRRTKPWFLPFPAAPQARHSSGPFRATKKVWFSSCIP